jgi:hypothetical protein
MSRASGARRAVAEIRWNDDANAIASVGNRSVHQYWTLLSAYFRDVLLPPQRRPEDNGVTWTWREATDAKPATASELSTLRKRLSGEHQLFVENLARGGLDKHGDAALPGQANVDQLGGVMSEVVTQLVGRSDADLTGFVCRTEMGLRLHSWGAAVPARPTYPDTQGLEIAGRVLVGGKPARHDVLLESGEGELLAEAPSDAAGDFRFSKLSPGDYRLRARSVRGTFPTNGLLVSLKHQSITDVVLADSSEAPAAAKISRGRSAGRSRRRMIVAVLAVVMAVISAGVWKLWPGSSEPLVAAAGTDDAKKSNPPAVTTDLKPPSAAPTTATAGKVDGKEADLGVKSRNVAAASSAKSNARRLDESSAGKNSRLPIEEHSSESIGAPPSPSALPTPPKGQSAASAAGANPPGGNPSVASSTPSAAAAGTASSPANPAGGPPGAATSAATPSTDSVSATATNAKPPQPLAANPVNAPVDQGTPPSPKPEVPPDVPPVTKDPAARKSEPVRPSDPTRPKIPDTGGDTASPVPVPPTEVAETKTEVPPEGESAPKSKSSPRINEPDTTAGSNSPARTDSATPPPADSRVYVPVAVKQLRLPPAPLTRTVRVRLSPWRARVLADTILPTQPVAAKADESVAALRARMLAEREAKIPAEFKNPVASTGVVLTLPAAYLDETLSWVDDAGAAVSEGTAGGGRARLKWTNSAMIQGEVFRLQRADKSIVAEVRIEPLGRDLTVRTTEDVRAWLLLGVETAPVAGGDETLKTASAQRYSWRTASGGPLSNSLPTKTRTDDREQQLNVALGSVTGASLFQTCALLDRETGWAVVIEMRQAADRPLGE